MSETLLAIVMAECKRPVQQCDGDLHAKLRASMLAAKDHWMVRDRDMQFRGAIAAVMDHYGDNSDEWKRISHELIRIQQLNAFLASAGAGLNPELPSLDGEDKPIGLLTIWREVLE